MAWPTAQQFNLCLALFLLSLLLALLAWLCGHALLLAVYNQTGPALLFVPFVAGEIGGIEFVVCLGLLLASCSALHLFPPSSHEDERIGEGGYGGCEAYLLTELLVNSITRILDCYTTEVSCCYLKTQWEMQVNLLNRWGSEVLLEVLLLLNRSRGLVDLPVYLSTSALPMCPAYPALLCTTSWNARQTSKPLKVESSKLTSSTSASPPQSAAQSCSPRDH